MCSISFSVFNRLILQVKRVRWLSIGQCSPRDKISETSMKFHLRDGTFSLYIYSNIFNYIELYLYMHIYTNCYI